MRHVRNQTSVTSGLTEVWALDISNKQLCLRLVSFVLCLNRSLRERHKPKLTPAQFVCWTKQSCSVEGSSDLSRKHKLQQLLFPGERLQQRFLSVCVCVCLVDTFMKSYFPSLRSDVCYSSHTHTHTHTYLLQSLAMLASQLCEEMSCWRELKCQFKLKEFKLKLELKHWKKFKFQFKCWKQLKISWHLAIFRLLIEGTELKEVK